MSESTGAPEFQPAQLTQPAQTAEGTASQGEPAKNPLDALLTSDKAAREEFDRRIDKAIETRRAKWEQDAATRVEEARTQAERLASMNAEQRAEHDRKEREEKLAQRERALTLRELRVTAGDELSRRELPTTLLDTLDYASADACQSSIERVEKAYRDSVQAGVEKRFRGSPPKAASGSPTDAHMAKVRQAFGLK
ncbi:MAG: DUF4355 domain-containing protein [Oscillospiraceae bacterium]|jgi:hypothetical protein|nr:DUF4355 domain-containing protein [Oscillospiraceae bacterium]